MANLKAAADLTGENENIDVAKMTARPTITVSYLLQYFYDCLRQSRKCFCGKESRLSLNIQCAELEFEVKTL